MIVKTDCRFYRGDVPCKFHKEEGVHCENCRYYVPVGRKYLIVKLGAAGDVLRTTPILRAIRKDDSEAEITWVTYYPELVPSGWVDRIYSFDMRGIASVLASSYDYCFSLDKDKEALWLAREAKAEVKRGFIPDERGNVYPLDFPSRLKWLTGLFDDISRKNERSYLEEIFEICGYEFKGERYIIERKELKEKPWEISKDKKVIGLNTGCGPRWKAREYPEENWIELAKLLIAHGYEVILLGGPDENDKNKRIAEESGARYFGYFPIKVFFELVSECDLVITGVTLALHVAIALERKIILLNNIFNKNEFELYGLGIVMEPPKKCVGCYRSFCDEKCMELIKPESILSEVFRLTSDIVV
ncbi:MAG: glycosyltransferase family 9 protein [Synergistetes bacterium]|nr:glycosyltransferase family 9 protein [Synergistota bacterium]